MRIGLYGMPTAGKTYLMNQIKFMEVIGGSNLLHEYDPSFDSRDESDKRRVREAFARKMMAKDNYIMDGHYAFGDKIVFTEEDGKLYDAFIYLYISPDIIQKRMMSSEKNKKYSGYDIEKWQNIEISELRKYCQENDKDFYVIDNPPTNYFEDVSNVIAFIEGIIGGYSCISYAQECAEYILKTSKSDTITLLDGDKTLAIEDSSKIVFGYETNLYDGNFYTGYQAWKQKEEFKKFSFDAPTQLPVCLNETVEAAITEDTYILTSGHEKVWAFIAKWLGLDFFCGAQMSAETKYFITKKLQSAGKKVIAYGDGLNDYFMLKQADKGFIITKKDGTISRSLKGLNMEGLVIV